ncbi:SNARE-interacting protein KEULE-like isoform X3 [Andrographis paniculata]|uniref:SNARE-interacting protein KEULE-like isoform X3 n=1 Tax=Andrographis paniculata TaxID=175694 RepID=UPI0021E74348|nr:SNARE-interacting protein KEULE-like isoform X3 [Andrographis paniculata]
MSCSDSDASSHGGAGGGEYNNFRQASRDRLLYEMLQTSKPGDSRSSWKVLIMDKVTVKVMSHSCKMADITDQGVSLDEDLYRRRQPLPSLDAIYFIKPTKENVILLLSDMSGREPLYRKAYVYFSSSISKDLVSRIKRDSSVLRRIGALREMNLEYFSIDSQGFITDHVNALEELFGQDAETSHRVDMCLNTMAKRIATVFASLKEFPYVWYRTARGLEDATTVTFRELIPTKLAAAVWDNISSYKSSIRNFPQTETCELLLIVDRSVDQIAPIIHEWTYDAMCHDLLELEGTKYVHEVPSKSGGQPDRKEVLLEDHDPIWLQLRHTHIAEASERLHEKMMSFASKNKAAQLQQRDGSALSTRDLQKLVQSLPEYNAQMEKLSLHVEIAGKLNKIIKDEGLQELGQLEQDLVFGDAGTKEMINYLRRKEDKSENNLRLMMIYAAVYPEKFEGDKASKLMQLAKLSDAEMKVVKNMKFIEGYNSKKDLKGAFSLFFSSGKRKHSTRKDRPGEEETWALLRFYPMIEELIEKLSTRELPKDEYQCMNGPSTSSHGSQAKTEASSATSVQAVQSTGPHSMRSRRTPSWARSRSSDGGYLSDSSLKSESSDFKKMGQRIFIFIIGGATRSELRVCHKLTSKLRREVVLGTTSIDNPDNYIKKLQRLSGNEEISIDDIDV